MTDPTRNAMPFLAQVVTEVQLHGLPESDAHYIYDHWLGNGFKTGHHKVKDWRAVIRVWKRGGYFPSQKAAKNPVKEGDLMTNEILDALAANPAYKKVDVQKEAWRFRQWCDEHEKPTLVTSFIKYLNAKL